jgi:lysophospholipase L1-like esterase
MLNLFRQRRFAVLFAISVISVVATAVLCLVVSELFFFDKFYYQKSPAHGYAPLIWNPQSSQDNPRTIERRLSDLRALFPLQRKTADLRVLGVSDEKKTKPFTIAVIGDSMVYGTGIRTGDRFSEVLEKKLNTLRPTNVITLAQPGDSAVDNYYKLQKLEEKIVPDLIIFGLVDNDLIVDSSEKYPGEKALYDQLVEVCPGQEHRLQDFNPVPEYEVLVEKLYLPAFEEGTANKCFLDEVLKKVQGKPLFFFSFVPIADDYHPAPGSVDDKNWQVIKKYVQTVQAAGFPVVSATNLAHFTYTNVSEKEFHPSAATHSQFAESLLKEITSNPQWKFFE